MAFDFEALVGHLYIVGGRSISAPPPGALVEVAPRKAARGRETDTFFVLVYPSGQVVAPPAFYEQMAALAAERYFTTSGSITAALRNVFATLNGDLHEHNISGKRAYEANMLCAVLHDQEVYLARVGSGIAFLSAEEQVTFPEDLSKDEAIFRPPMGVHPVADVRMTRYPVVSGSRLILGDAGLADLDRDKLWAGLKAPDIAAALSALKEMVTAQLTLLAVEFVPPEIPVAVPTREAESTVRQPAPPEPEPTTAETLPPPPPPGKLAQAAESVGLRAQQGTANVAQRAASALAGADTLLDKALPDPKEGQRSWIASPAAAGIAVLIPVIVVVVVIVMWLAGTGESEFELCVEEATQATQTAQGIASSDVQGTLAAWNAVLAVVNRCDQMRAGDPTLAAYTRQAQSVIDHLSSIERRDVYVLKSFRNAILEKIVLSGLDLYMLDTQNQQVYRVTLTSDGRGTVPSAQEYIPAMRINATIGQFRVGNMIDIAWSDDDAEIVAVDQNGLVINCSARLIGTCGAQRLQGTERWGNPTGITLWGGKLYILDPEANQLWRYEATGGSYLNPPIEYFTGEGRPDIRTAVDFAIDDNGVVFVLLANGTLIKFFSGTQQPFGYAAFPESQPLTSANDLFLDSTQQLMYIVSRAERTIYETTYAGAFVNSYRAFDENMFVSLSAVVADTNQQVIYALSGNSVLIVERQATQ
ncbi:MAG: hypothetical protein H6672_21025 [Anaerolineaceae bacterium]|nr:hypothetical protein [Anaerolineaceae bacterium]